jgi:hypothetical protein
MAAVHDAGSRSEDRAQAINKNTPREPKLFWDEHLNVSMNESLD